MRESDGSSAVSPERWEGGGPQRARHMSAMESGTEMSPCPRGYRWPARDALDGVMMLSSRPGMEVRGLGGLGGPLHGGCSQGASARSGKVRARVGKEEAQTAARHRARFPNNIPCGHRSSSQSHL